MEYPGHPQFNEIIYYRMAGDLDIARLRACIIRVLERNDPWRLRFAEEDGQPYQWLDPADPEVAVIDFSDQPASRASIAGWVEHSMAHAFELTGSSLFRVGLLCESESVTYLFAKAHHIVSDGWTLRLCVTQILADYEQVQRTGEAACLPATSCRDVIGAETRYLESPKYELDRQFFRTELEDASPSLFPRKAPPGSRTTAHHTAVIESELAARMLDNGITPSVYISAILAIYLSRCHRADDVILGIPFVNRGTEGEWKIWGQLASILPLRVAVPGDITMRELADQVMASMLALRSRQRFSLGDVVREAAAHQPATRQLFDVALSYLSLPPPPQLPGVTSEHAVLLNCHDQDALSIVVRAYEGAGDLYVDLHYASDVFDEDMPIERFVAAIEALSRDGLDGLDRPVSGLSMTTAADREALLRLGSGPSAVFRPDATIHGLFQEQAVRAAHSVGCVTPEGATATYAELDAWANQAARALRARGIGVDDRVAVMMERGLYLPAALLAVLKAGGAYVPIDPGYPPERIRHMVTDSRAKAVLVSRSGRREAGPDAIATAEVCAVEDLLGGSDEPLASASGPGDLAYVIYTSGSTGTPKGVMVEHRSVVNRLAWMQQRYPIGRDDVLLQKTPISFDVSVWELFWWGVQGATVALLPPGAEGDPLEILDVIAECRVSVIHFVPSMLGPFLDLLDTSPGLRTLALSLRLVFCSGEALPPARVAQFNRIFGRSAGRIKLVNLYGPTEATVDVSYFDCPAEPDTPVAMVPIGKPIDNIRLYVLDQYGNPQPAGVAGELCIAGVGVARGYLGRPDLTQEKFTADPFVRGERMYRTGDLARWLADGNLEYLSRLDGQVKIRGNRVELGEVENALARVGGVRDAIVVDQRSDSRGTYLVGYYVADARLEVPALRAELARSLPDFMIPARFALVDRIPLTPNGKADRKALTRLSAAAAPDAYQAPRDDVEAALALAWSQALAIERVGIHDNYYALGGDSINALRVRAVAARSGLRFSLTDLIQNPTVAELARRVTPVSGGPELCLEPFDLVPKVDRAKLEGFADAYPMTRLQLGMLYHSRQHQRSSVYQDVFRYTFVLRWDEGEFRKAVARLIARHPALRTCFGLAGFTEPLQLVQPVVPVGLEIVDLRSLADQDAEAEVLRHAEERRYHRYEFDRAPLYLFRIHVRAGAADAAAATVDIVFSFHHAILDGGSIAGLLAELLRDYLRAAAGERVAPGSSAAEAPPSPAHYVIEERRALESADARSYWQRKLEGAGRHELLSLWPYEPPGASGFLADMMDLPAGLEQAVQAFADDHRVSVKSVLFATYCQALRLFSGAEDITTGLVTHGRPEMDGAERMAGLFLNTVPVRLAGASASWLTCVREVFTQEQADHPYRRYPLSTILRDHGDEALVDTAFNYVHFRVLAPVLTGVDAVLTGFQAWEKTNLKLLVNAATDPRNGRLRLRIDCDATSFTASQAEMFAQAYVGILGRMLAHPDEAPDFRFLSNAAAAPPPVTGGATDVVRMFEEQAAGIPDAVAVASGETRWTYAGLNRAARDIARRLLAAGGVPGEMTVGIATERSPELIAAVLGIAMAGGACVPLDPSYPRARLRSMMAHARPFRLIAHGAYADLADDPWAVIPAESITPDTPDAGLRRPGIDPGSAVYILFTSGSTGTPKGVVLPHRALANLIVWQNGHPGGAPGATTLQFAPLSFDVSFQEIFATLCSGGSLQLIDEADRQDMRTLLRLLDRAGIEQIFMPYVALQQLAEAADTLGIMPHKLHVVHSSGEQLRVTGAIRRLCAANPGVVLNNQYGPTETHVVTSFPMSGDPAAFPMLPPIGSAISGAKVRVLDAKLRPVPPGVPGEIFVGGVCLADGYLGRPDLTDERFISHPREAAGDRLYRTGDLGIVMADGQIAYLGRADKQVKVRGFRIEPGEVEHSITGLAARYPGIRDAAVVASTSHGGETFLAAFLVGAPETVTSGEILRELRSLLPGYMVPSHVEWLDSMPRTPSGKRDDEALRHRPLTRPRAAADGGMPPADGYERALLEVVADLLQLPGLGVDDNLFDLGATSLTAMRIVMTVEQRFGVQVPLSLLIEAPSVAAVAAHLRRAGAVATFNPLVPIRPPGRAGDSARPLFLVHPIGGNVLCYLPLAKHLPEDRPLYALQAGGAEPGSVPKDTVAELAASYLTAMRQVQPEGSYLIGGWSFGGLVAFEMARQLRQAGDELAGLIIIDTVMPDPEKFTGATDDFVLSWFFWELLLLERGSDSPVEVIPAELGTHDEKFEFIAQYAARLGVLPTSSSGALVRRLFDVYKANALAAVNYRPGLLDRDITLLRCACPLPEKLRGMHDVVGGAYNDPANGWSGRTSASLKVIQVPGDHLTIMEEPHVKSLAAVIMNLIG
jgi:amino acid adenylation domain-containing protein